MSSGIYGIFSRNLNRVYIGQAQNIQARWSVHISALNRGSHHCSFMQRHFNKNKDLELHILLTCEEERLSFFENQQWKWYKFLGYQMFNSEMSAETGCLRGENNPRTGNNPFTVEQCLAISERLTGEGNYWYGRKQSEEHKRKRIDKQKGCLHWSKNLGDKPHPLRGIPCNSEAKQKISDAQKGELNHRYGKRNNTKQKIAVKEANIKYFYELEKNGVIYACESLKEFADFHKIDSSSLARCFNRVYKQSKGFYPLTRTELSTGIVEIYNV